jgi:hypothetical protein
MVHLKSSEVLNLVSLTLLKLVHDVCEVNVNTSNHVLIKCWPLTGGDRGKIP